MRVRAHMVRQDCRIELLTDTPTHWLAAEHVIRELISARRPYAVANLAAR